MLLHGGEGSRYHIYGVIETDIYGVIETDPRRSSAVSIAFIVTIFFCVIHCAILIEVLFYENATNKHDFVAVIFMVASCE